MNNLVISGMMLIAVSVLLLSIGSAQDVLAFTMLCPPNCGDVLVEEAAEAGNTTTTSEPEFLFIQHAQSGSISEINATAYTLELNDVSDKTILFSDRPYRIVTSVDTANFVGNWPAGPDSFVADPPNAALIIQGGVNVGVLELFNPVYDVDNQTLRYDVTPVNATSIELPNEFGQSTLVVDGDGWCSKNPCGPP